MGRTIVIGDVHGCAIELDKLIEKIKPRTGDNFIQLGDLINKGPDSRGAIAIARAFNMDVVMGNHELRLLSAKESDNKSKLKTHDHETLDQLTSKDWKYIKKFPKYIYKKSLRTIFVHGGFIPNKPWRNQGIEVVTEVQVIDKKGRPKKRSDAPKGELWAKLWDRKKSVVYGHLPRKKAYKIGNTLCIDTGCVYGGHLTAYIVEEKRTVRVKAKKAYR